MALLIIIILAIIQGASEFLPISSSGHLVLAYNIFNVKENVIFLSIFLHVATLLSLLVVYYKEFWQLIKHPFCKTNKLILVATVITGILAIAFKPIIEKSFNGQFLIYAFLTTAMLLFIAEQVHIKQSKENKKWKITTINNSYDSSEKHKNLTTSSNELSNSNMFLSESDTCNMDLNYKQAIIIGLFQSVATLPGISRSGATISAGLLTGGQKKDVANFSFILSFPIILASLFLELWGLRDTGMGFDFSAGELLIGFFIAFLVGLLCLKVMLKIVKRQKLYLFSIYLLILCVVLLFNQFVFNLF